nr:next to BRCA1 gene 1 protein-like [Misgurnus anguillicaudatus]
MAAAGELRCEDSAIESVLEDIDSALILKEEKGTSRFSVTCERKAEKVSDPEVISAPLKIETARVSPPAQTHTETAEIPTPLLAVSPVLIASDEGHESDIEQILVEPAIGEQVEEEDYIIILADCFDTSRPLIESIETGIVVAPRPTVKTCTEVENRADKGRGPGAPEDLNEKDAEVNKSDPENASVTIAAKSETEELRANSITGGLVKGALSVAASAYKALFTGQTGSEKLPEDAASHDAMMAVLVEMGFGDRALNQHLLQKHNCNLLDVVNELVQMSDNDWYTKRY